MICFGLKKKKLAPSFTTQSHHFGRSQSHDYHLITKCHQVFVASRPEVKHYWATFKKKIKNWKIQDKPRFPYVTLILNKDLQAVLTPLPSVIVLDLSGLQAASQNSITHV